MQKPERDKTKRDDTKKIATNSVKLLGKNYDVQKISGRKFLILPIADIREMITVMQSKPNETDYALEQAKGLRVKIITSDKKELLSGEKLGNALKIMQLFNTGGIPENTVPLQKNFSLSNTNDLYVLVAELPKLFRTAAVKRNTKELGFVTLCSDGTDVCWFKTMRKFQNALYEAFATVQLIAAKSAELSEAENNTVKTLYAQMSRFVK